MKAGWVTAGSFSSAELAAWEPLVRSRCWYLATTSIMWPGWRVCPSGCRIRCHFWSHPLRDCSAFMPTTHRTKARAIFSREDRLAKCGSPGRIRTSDMTVNSRPLYRLSYRGVFWFICAEPELFSIYARRREIKNRHYNCKSAVRINPNRARCRSLADFGALQRFVLHLAHLPDGLGNKLRGEYARQS